MTNQGNRNRRLDEFTNQRDGRIRSHVMAGDANSHNGAWREDEDDERGGDILA